MANPNRNDDLSKVAKDLMLQQPYYGLFLLMLNKRWASMGDRCDTAMVTLAGISYSLVLNEDFWMGLEQPRKKGLLQHELMHIAFHHLTTFAHLEHQDIANMAEDIEINQYIDRDHLPEGGCFIDNFPELNLDEKAGTMYYYEKLLQASKNKGTCPNLDSYMQGFQNQESVIVIIGEDGDPKNANLPDHSGWSSTPMTEAATRIIETQIKHILNEVAEQVLKSRGTIPGEIQQILDKINEIEPPKFDWRGYIRRFTTGSIKTYTKLSRRKPNRRIDGMPAIKVKKRKHILVGIDTSGSVSDEELKEFMQEIHHIYRTGSVVTIAHVDTAIKKIGFYNPRDDWSVYGRGGTDFNPLIDYYNEERDKYTCLIYLTDGEAPAPDNPVRGRMLWVLSTKSKETDHLPGPTVKLN